MYERFTDQCRKVMAYANQEAQQNRNDSIGTEHLLAGLLRQPSCLGCKILRELGCDLDRMRGDIKATLEYGSIETFGKLPTTPEAKGVVQLAIEEARREQVDYVGTEHLLLGLIRQPDTVASRVLTAAGMAIDLLRETVATVHNGELKISESAPSRAAGRLRSQLLKLLSGDNSAGTFEVLSHDGGATVVHSHRTSLDLDEQALAGDPSAVQKCLGLVADRLERAAQRLRDAAAFVRNAG